MNVGIDLGLKGSSICCNLVLKPGCLGRILLR